MLDRVRRSLRAEADWPQVPPGKVIERSTRWSARTTGRRSSGSRAQRDLDGLREDVRHQSDRIVETTRQLEVRARRDLVFAGEREAALQSAQFVRDHMPKVPQFGHPHETLEHALGLVPAGRAGAGVRRLHRHHAQDHRCRARRRDVYGFDSFEGLPENWRNGFPAGAFNVDGLPDVPGAELVVGWFDDTLPGFLDEHEGPVAFLHVDCDLYSSTKTVLDLVGPRLVPGSIVAFDEYFNFPGWDGARAQGVAGVRRAGPGSSSATRRTPTTTSR